MNLNPNNLVFADIESRSRADLDCVGASKYAEHPSTEVLVLRFRRGLDGVVERWFPGDPVPALFRDPTVTHYVACNAGFEADMTRAIMTPVYGFPDLPDARWICEAAMAGYAGIDQGLDGQSKKLNLGDYGKDHTGHLNMMRLCKPNNVKGTAKIETVDGILYGGEFDNDPDKHAKNVDYCGQDVIAECAAFHQLPEFPDRERRAWLLGRKINARGVPVDLDLCHGAVQIIREATETHLAELERITRGQINVGKLVNGSVTSVDERERIKYLCAQQGIDLRTDPTDDGETPNLQEGTINAVLARLDPDDDRPAKRVLEIRQLLTGAAAKKYQATIDWADDDWRCRGGFKYYGCGPGRWSGTQAQFQNLKRPDRKKDIIAAALPLITAGDYAALGPLSAVKLANGGERFDVFGLLGDCVRSIIMAEPGQTLTVSDFAGVEARVLAWLADAPALLAQFRANEDVYVKMACDILGCGPDEVVNPETKKAETPEQIRNRQIGKCPFLGAGYQMAWKHMKEVAKAQAGVDMSDELAMSIIDTFRGNNPEIPQFWRDIENAAKYVVNNPEKTISHPKFRFRMWGEWLVMRIPSGRELFYWKPRLEWRETEHGRRKELCYTSARGTKQLYGGLLTENIDQAVARDLLVDAMHRLDALDVYTVMHCHDETVNEGPIDQGERKALVHWAMTQTESWSDGIPMGAETKEGVRYAK